MSVYQYSSYNRVVDFFGACFRLPISEGCIDGFLESMSNKAIPAYEQIRQQIHVAEAVSELVELWLAATKPVAK